MAVVVPCVFDLPKCIFREIFEYLIEAYEIKAQINYMSINKRSNIIFKEVIRFYLEKFRKNPYLAHLYGIHLEAIVKNFYQTTSITRLFPPPSEGQDQHALQAIRFMQLGLISKITERSVIHAIRSIKALDIILTEGENFSLFQAHGLNYESVIGPIVIELFVNNWDNPRISQRAYKFFNNPNKFMTFMLFNVVDWMKLNNIPDSKEDQQKLINAVYLMRLNFYSQAFSLASFIAVKVLFFVILLFPINFHLIGNILITVMTVVPVLFTATYDDPQIYLNTEIEED